MSTMDARELRDEVRELLESLADRLPQRRLAGYRALGESGESVKLLDEICKMLVARHTQVRSSEKAALALLLDAVRDDVGDEFGFILDRAGTLGAIEVAEQPRVITNDDLRWLNAQSKDLLESLADRLPAEALESNRSLSAAGEQAFMLDNLCAGLVLDSIPVSPSERNALATLLNWFRPTAVADLPRIRDKESTLASLNVAEQL